VSLTLYHEPFRSLWRRSGFAFASRLICNVLQLDMLDFQCAVCNFFGVLRQLLRYLFREEQPFAIWLLKLCCMFWRNQSIRVLGVWREDRSLWKKLGVKTVCFMRCFFDVCWVVSMHWSIGSLPLTNGVQISVFFLWGAFYQTLRAFLGAWEKASDERWAHQTGTGWANCFQFVFVGCVVLWLQIFSLLMGCVRMRSAGLCLEVSLVVQSFRVQ
jgi:hypothetical protein